MKYLYTDKPDESCHEVAPGVYGRPVHTYEQAKLRAAGWKSSVGEFEPKQKEAEDDLETLRELYEEAFGEKPHHKTKAATLRAKIEEA